MWIWWSLLWGCVSGPDLDTLAERLITEDVDAVALELEGLPEATTEPLASWQRLARQLSAIRPERDAVQLAERQMLIDAATEALSGSRPSAAAVSIRAGLGWNPDDPAFQSLLQSFHDAAEHAPPGEAAEMFLVLAELQPDAADAHMDRAAAAALSVRYAPEAVQATRAAQAGARQEAAVHLLEALEQEYHVPPRWAQMVAAGQRRLEVLSAAPEARAVMDGLDIVQWPSVGGDGLAGVTDAVATLTANVAAAEAVGIPAEVVVVEWVDAALSSLDPWTRAVWPAEIASWQAHHEGVRYGVGLSLTATDAGSVFINRPQLDTPAWDSPLRQGDRIDRIHDAQQDVVLSALPAPQRLPAAEDALLGEAGSSVVLEVTRVDEGPMSVSLVRAPVKLETLHGLHRQEDNSWQLWLDASARIAYVRLLAFREHTKPDFDALLGATAGSAAGLLVDLRGNPGGDLNAAIQISDRFVASGVLAELAGRHPKDDGPPIDPETGEELIPWNHAIAGHAQEGLPVVVLVDSETASAAEILAGVLQERADAILVGTPTWGKGYTQVLRHEPEVGYAVQFTNQVWTLPSGRQLSNVQDGAGGLQPDVVVRLSPGEAYQAQLLARQRAALQRHRDGTPLEWMDSVLREDLPPLSTDPMLVYGELVLRALIHHRTAEGSR